ncbi:type II toxin-antitoxin system RelE/ParE family toxin [Candidatus Microgenomates bacterium]|nr:type II toxin-antitoxin system RelE/ParE family toxin [Candidatus Microgenomates bacterium]
MGWKVKFFQTARGEFPVKEFIQKQDEATYAKFLQFLGLLRDGGPFLKPPYIKKLQDKLYELRISGKTAVRIFYTIVNNEYYLLHAFKKKSQKTPRQELETALDRLKSLI